MHLKPEYQGVILNNYKLTELYSIFYDDQEYQKYLTDLMHTASAYTNMVTALILLHKEAVLDHLGENNIDIFESVDKVYECMTEEQRKTLSRNLLDKDDFFKNTYEIMMGAFQNAMKNGKQEDLTSNE